MDKYCTICKLNELLTPQEITNKACDVCFGKKDMMKEKHTFLDRLLENCDIDSTGQFYCKKCKNLVRVDWHRNIAFCGIHIISRVGVLYIEELYNIHV